LLLVHLKAHHLEPERGVPLDRGFQVAAGDANVIDATQQRNQHDLSFPTPIGMVTDMSEPRQPVLVGGARTPVGRLMGSLASKSASELGGVAIAGALRRAGIGPEQVQYVIMGQVLQAGAGQITARQAAVAAGLAMDIPAVTVNKVCLSGLDAIALASQLIRLGEYDVIVAGGMESMTQAPHLLRNSRAGYRFGPVTVDDSMALDGLTDAFDHLSMGESTENSVRKLGITRAEQDEFAAMSHQRAAAAAKNGLFADEIVAVQVPQRGGDPLSVTEDEGIRPGTTAQTLGKLKPAFGQDGTITAGTSSQISDGAAAVVVMSAEAAQRAGAQVLAEIGAHGNVAGPDNSLHSQPSNAIKQALAKAGLTAPDLDLIEINEAFAVVAIQSMRDLDVSPDIVNVNGGAIALGHPIGASGARIALHLANELRRRGGGLGAAGLCGGGGQGEALLLRVPA
jgi:acetyl-CoA C-acetyltransferase